MKCRKSGTSLEISAKTVDEAKRLCIEELQAPADEVEFEIIEEGSKGFLGIGGKEAKVKGTLRLNLQRILTEFLDSMMQPMNIAVTYEISQEENSLKVNILGEDMGILIGRRGETLDSIQYLASLVVNRYTPDYIKVYIDTENYKSKRQDTLQKLAKRLASQVIRTRRSITLEPMSPNERRIIHSTLQSNRLVYTYSTGEEPNRKVVISLKEKKSEN